MQIGVAFRITRPVPAAPASSHIPPNRFLKGTWFPPGRLTFFSAPHLNHPLSSICLIMNEGGGHQGGVPAVPHALQSETALAAICTSARVEVIEKQQFMCAPLTYESHRRSFWGSPDGHARPRLSRPGLCRRSAPRSGCRATMTAGSTAGIHLRTPHTRLGGILM